MTQPGYTRRDYRCPQCKTTHELMQRLSDSTHMHCPDCGARMSRYFGNTRETLMNLGFVESRYATEADANIAKYQFQHL